MGTLRSVTPALGFYSPYVHRLSTRHDAQIHRVRFHAATHVNAHSMCHQNETQSTNLQLRIPFIIDPIDPKLLKPELLKPDAPKAANPVDREALKPYKP